MSAPGTEVISRASPASASPPLDTSQCFVAGLTERGTTDTALGPFRSRDEVEAATGPRVAYGYIWDFADVYFREGGSELYVARVVGPEASAASATLTNGSEGTLTVTAASPGAWGNDLEVVVSAESGDFTLTVKLGEDVVETSPTLADNTEAVAWAANSAYIRLTDLGKGDPAAETKELTGGDDDREAVTDTQREAALALFTSDLGPGQVCYPGGTTATIHAALLAHAEANSRVALLDLPDSATVATLAAVAASDRALDTARYGAAFAPWAEVPGIAPGTTRIVPYSAVQAGLIARSDGAGLSPNVAAAGVNGVATYAIGLSQEPWTEAQRDTLNDAGVNVALIKYGTVRTYGYRTLVNPLTNDDWLQFTNARLNMAISAEGEVIAERYVFAQIDGRGIKVGEFAGELSGMLLGLYTAGSLYGASPEEAFAVEVGPQVNPPAQLEEGILRAVLEVRMSPFAERVVVEIVKTAITDSV